MRARPALTHVANLSLYPEISGAPKLPPSRWGTRLFFDSQRRCTPQGQCPTNFVTFKKLCEVSHYKEMRRIWKPLVVPHMMWDVSMHGFTPMAIAANGQPGPGYSDDKAGDSPSGVWCPCLPHGEAAAAAAVSTNVSVCTDWR